MRRCYLECGLHKLQTRDVERLFYVIVLRDLVEGPGQFSGAVPAASERN
jgi:hypothetical protein